MYKPSHGLLGKAAGQLANNVDTPFKYDVKTVRPYVKQHMITLCSVDRIAGTPQNHAVFTINKPVDISLNARAVILVDKFLIDNDLTGNDIGESNIDSFVFQLHIPELSQPLSYHSARGGNSDVVLSWKGHSYQNQNGYGAIPLVDYKVFQNRQITVNITSEEVSLDANWSQDWTLVLVILEEIYD